MSQALDIVYQALIGKLNEFSFKARSNVDQRSNHAKSNTSAYYQSNQYALKLGGAYTRINDTSAYETNQYALNGWS